MFCWILIWNQHVVYLSITLFSKLLYCSCNRLFWLRFIIFFLIHMRFQKVIYFKLSNRRNFKTFYNLIRLISFIRRWVYLIIATKPFDYYITPRTNSPICPAKTVWNSFLIYLENIARLLYRWLYYWPIPMAMAEINDEMKANFVAYHLYNRRNTRKNKWYTKITQISRKEIRRIFWHGYIEQSLLFSSVCIIENPQT